MTVKFDVAGAAEGSEPRSMRKFYRFSVMNPVSMSSVCTSVKGNPLVELKLRNTTQVKVETSWWRYYSTLYSALAWPVAAERPKPAALRALPAPRRSRGT